MNLFASSAFGCDFNPRRDRRTGDSHFLFASDFSHEIGPEDIMHEIEEVQEYPGLNADKAAILGGNARRFYQIPQGQ